MAKTPKKKKAAPKKKAAKKAGKKAATKKKAAKKSTVKSEPLPKLRRAFNDTDQPWQRWLNEESIGSTDGEAIDMAPDESE